MQTNLLHPRAEGKATHATNKCRDGLLRPSAQIVSKLAGGGVQHAYVDGGITIQQFLRAGLVQRLIITRVPVLIGDGIPLFGGLPRDVRLRHVATHHYPSGLVKTEYRVAV